MQTATAPAAVPPAGGRRLFIACPSYDGWVREEQFEGLRRSNDTAERWTRQAGRGSLLAYCFNQLLHAAYNSRAEHGWTHWLMHHADLSAPPGFADLLMGEMDRVGADVLSAAVAIKDGRGLTSTGLADPRTGSIRRLTMSELGRLPPTFDGPAACRALGAPDDCGLAVNTGLMLLRCGTVFPFLRPGARGPSDPGLYFSVLDGVREGADGKLTTCTLPEDWHFSRQARERGLRVFCTRRLEVRHYGGQEFYPSGAGPWGAWETDEGDLPDPAERVEGWMTRAELVWLRRAAARAASAAEVGCWKGRSTLALAESCPGTVYAVDHFQGSPGDRDPALADARRSGPAAREAFLRNLNGHIEARKVVLLDAPSLTAALALRDEGRRFDLVFIDAAHDFPSVASDVAAWLPLVAPGGTLAGHDRDLPGVRRAIDELLPGWRPAAGSIWEVTV